LAVDYPNPTRGLRDLVAGTEIEVPVLDGTRRRYINFDNAASTPALKAVRDGIDRFLDYYSSVHRGTGFKSQLATWAYEQARHQTLASSAPGRRRTRASSERTPPRRPTSWRAAWACATATS